MQTEFRSYPALTKARAFLSQAGALLWCIEQCAHLFHKLGIIKEIGETPRFLVRYGLSDWAGVACNDGTFGTHGLLQAPTEDKGIGQIDMHSADLQHGEIGIIRHASHIMDPLPVLL